MKRFNAAKALRSDDNLAEPLRKAVMYIFNELIYKPIFQIVKEEITDEWIGLELPKILKERKEQKADDRKEEIKRNKEIYSYLYHNAKMKDASQDPLVRAILSGRIQYVGDHFQGSFNSQISKEIKKLGGVWNFRRKQWRLERSKLPPQVSLAIGTASGKIGHIKDKISNHLSELDNLIKQKPLFELQQAFKIAIGNLEVQFGEGVKDFIIPPEFTPEMIENLATNYSNNMSLYIQNWTEESIKRLRDRVLVNTFEGNRAETLVKTLEHDFQISYNKAKFLARQETSLLMSQYREERYKSIGVQKYKWSTSGDSRVRPMHKRLNGKVFDWDNPPVVDEMGHRRHPGEDFGCRCIAIPLLDDGEWHPNYSIGSKDYDVTNPKEFIKAKNDLEQLMKQKKQFAYDKYERIDERYRTEEGLKSLKKDFAKMDKELYWRTKDLLGQANPQSNR